MCCHSLAWPADPSDARARYAGSGLFHVALYDGLHRCGYVRAVPGAPMCACVKQMPTVSRAGCTQLDVDETWEFGVDAAGTLDARIVEVEIDFKACQVSPGRLQSFSRALRRTSAFTPPSSYRAQATTMMTCL